MSRIPPLHVVTDDGVLARPEFAARARDVLAAGGRDLALHLRGPRTGGRLLYELAADLASPAGEAGALLLVNDRVDVALAAGADGVHLGARGMRPRDARALLGEGRVVGLSVHAAAEAEGLRPGEVDFLLVGTLYATPSHPGREGAGPGVLRDFAGTGVPLVGIGGVTPERVGEVLRAGARGVAVLRAVWSAPDPAEAVRRFLQEMSGSDV